MHHSGTTNRELRKRRHARVRARVKGTAARPRLAVFKSNRFISVQLIDDTAGKTIASAHGRDVGATQPRRSQSGSRPQRAPASVQAKQVGEAIAKVAKTAGIGAIVFDRGGYRYGGQVKVLADAAREGGLTF